VYARQHATAGLRLSAATIAWTVAASTVEVSLGLSRHVLSLVAFGAAGLLDAAGSVALVISFRHALRHDGLADHHERRAARIIGIGMLVLGAMTIAESVRRLIAGSSAHSTLAGVLVAAASILVLSVLSIAKRRVARDIGSDALRADANLSAAGAALAAVAVIGASVNSVDAVAAIVIAIVTVRIGAQVASGPRTGQSPPG
jgi:divalent metal cation (Fe/Co/Zn/Cd) transporter